jgi:hypothetical protein
MTSVPSSVPGTSFAQSRIRRPPPLKPGCRRKISCQSPPVHERFHERLWGCWPGGIPRRQPVIHKHLHDRRLSRLRGHRHGLRFCRRNICTRCGRRISQLPFQQNQSLANFRRRRIAPRRGIVGVSECLRRQRITCRSANAEFPFKCRRIRRSLGPALRGASIRIAGCAAISGINDGGARNTVVWWLQRNSGRRGVV